jgi:hypothetical protein
VVDQYEVVTFAGEDLGEFFSKAAGRPGDQGILICIHGTEINVMNSFPVIRN